MTTTTSFSKHSRRNAMFRYAFKTNLPVLILSALISIITLPILFAINSSSYSYATHHLGSLFLMGAMVEETTAVMTVLLSGLAVVSTLMTNRYLHAKPMTDLFHALPMQRHEMLAVNLAATVSSIGLPFMISLIITIVMEVARFSGYGLFGSQFWGLTLYSTVTILLAVITVSLFVSLISVNLGTVFDSLSISMTVGFAPPLLCILVLELMSEFLYGVRLSPYKPWLLSPLTWSIEAVYYVYRPNSVKAIVFMLVWILLIAVLFALTVYLYRRRDSELAGTSARTGVLSIIMKIVAPTIGGIIFFFAFEPYSTPAQLFFLLFGVFSIGIVVEIILSRGIRFIPKNIRWIAVAAVFTLIIYAGGKTDLFRLERKVPAPSSVKSIALSYNGRFDDLDEQWYYYNNGTKELSSPEAIDIVVRTHQSFVDDHRNPKGVVSQSLPYNYFYANLSINYTKTSGRVLERYYWTGSPAAINTLTELEGNEEFIRTRSTLFQIEAFDEDAQCAIINNMTMSDSFFKQEQELRLDNSKTIALLQAVREDMLAESLSEIQNPSAPVLGYLTVKVYEFDMKTGEVYTYDDGRPRASSRYDGFVFVPITQQYTRTLKALQSFGYDFADLDNPLDTVIKASIFSRSECDYNNGSLIFAITPARMNNFLSRERDYESDNSDGVIVTDQNEIKGLYAAGKHQIEASATDIDCVVIFYDEAGPLGAKYLREGDIPKQYRDIIYNDMFPYTDWNYEGDVWAENAVSEVIITDTVSAVID